MSEVLELPEKPQEKPKTYKNQYDTKIDWKVVETLYVQHGLMPAQIAAKTGFNIGTISVGISTRGFARARKAADKLINPNAGDRLKTTLGTIAQGAADVLALKTPKQADKLNLHVDSALKTAKLGATIYGWDNNVLLSIVTPGTLGGMDPQEQDVPVIDVSEVDPEPQS
jgi:hypothetical protein